MSDGNARRGETPAQALFATTHWSVVLAAKDPASPGCAQALEALCGAYWYPLYVFVRSSGYSPQDAQDLTQEFFARLLAKNYLRVVDPEKGRFRNFLRMALKRFLANEWVRLRAAKRGGATPHLPFDASEGETRFHHQSATPSTPWQRGGKSASLSPDLLANRCW